MEIYEITSLYLNSTIKGLRKKKLEKKITNNTVFKAVMLIFPLVAQRVKEKNNKYSEEGFDEILIPLYHKIKESKIATPGLSYKILADYLTDNLSSGFTL